MLTRFLFCGDGVEVSDHRRSRRAQRHCRDEYDLLDYYGPAHRRRGAEEWTVVADLPEVVTISPQMLDVLELWFGDILDELLIDECASREHGDHAHGD
ncbi:hypothetical protein [Sphingopyxis sp. LC81]|uniref:hypothetical protein n=1 Tax=Sphingopyxis sp. LC81 TaxID=1502850 RepID=UPI00190F76B0|nr:hypothetical protein [Sphingopyxis sp. LC81]